MKKYLVYIIIGLIIAGGAVYYFTRPKKEKGTSYLTTKVVRQDLNVTVTATGIINPDSNIAVGTQISGKIAKIFVDFNSKVKEGELLALIDTTPLQEAVNDARATLEKTKAMVFQTQKAFERSKILLEGKAAAQADYDLAEASYKSALADKLSATANLNKALNNLKYAYIRAPISGTVVSRNVDVGQTVAASFTTPTLFMIANNLKKMQVQAAVDETDIGLVEMGQQVIFTVDAYPSLNFYGKVSQIRLQPTVTNNVVNYSVIVEVDNSDLKLMPGMTANITFQVLSHKNVLTVPTRALTFSPEGSEKPVRKDTARSKPNNKSGSIVTGNARVVKHGKVWIVAGDSIKLVRVTLGISNGTLTEVEGDIKEGDEVATGIASADNPNATPAKSPFTPSFQRGQRKGK
jgi:HlyD family secretion protein